MAGKKKLATAKQKQALKIASKAIRAMKPKAIRAKKASPPKTQERWATERQAFVGSIVALQSPDGRWAVHISTYAEAPVEDLVVTVNGRSVWQGRP